MQLTVDRREQDESVTITTLRAPVGASKEVILEMLQDAIKMVTEQYEHPRIPLQMGTVRWRSLDASR